MSKSTPPAREFRAADILAPLALRVFTSESASTSMRSSPTHGLSPKDRLMLGKVAAVTLIVTVLALLALAVRVSNDQVTREIRVYTQQADKAVSTHDRLMLDYEARASKDHLEQAATALGLVPTRVEVISARPQTDGAAQVEDTP